MSEAELDRLRRALAAPLAHPDLATLRTCTDQTTAWLLEHFATLPEQSIGRVAGRAEMERG